MYDGTLGEEPGDAEDLLYRPLYIRVKSKVHSATRARLARREAAVQMEKSGSGRVTSPVSKSPSMLTAVSEEPERRGSTPPLPPMTRHRLSIVT